MKNLNDWQSDEAVKAAIAEGATAAEIGRALASFDRSMPPDVLAVLSTIVVKLLRKAGKSGGDVFADLSDDQLADAGKLLIIRGLIKIIAKRDGGFELQQTKKFFKVFGRVN